MIFNYKTNSNTDDTEFSKDYSANLLKNFETTINDPKIGFFHLSDNQSYIDQTKEIFEQVKDKTDFIQIGIGGSALGPQMLIDSLGKPNGVNFFFLDNTDADYTKDILHKINAKKALFYVVSKSGGTAETIANFIISRNFLIENGIAKEDLNKHFVFCTDPEAGHLRKLANEENYLTLSVPSSVGGRFSVLTPVGLLPAIFAGINIDELYKGANDLKSSVLNQNSDLFKSAIHLAHLFFKQDINQTILMPYSSKLKSFSNWFVQLWGESLGKHSSELNKATGLTPIPAYGATDQHSQMQLFMEGINDKFMFLLNIKNKQNDFNLESDLNMESAKSLSGFSLNQLLEAQFHGTLSALSDMKRNVTHIEIEELNEKSLGGLILFFESLTAVMGDVLKIDPFNQPGVELGKKYAYEYLKKFE